MNNKVNSSSVKTALLDSSALGGIDTEAIELASAYGPYTHGVWAGRKLTVGNEEALTGRGAFLAATIRKSILKRYTIDQIRKMTLVDVGCYDGWLLCQLEDIPFFRVVGIEPRKKNLDKGKMIRQLLDVETRCEFLQGSIEDLEAVLGSDGADIVICTGLFHHLSSTLDGVASLHAICREFLFLETICFPATWEDERLRDTLELKDLPYLFGKNDFGITGHKLESGYYDGSATKLSVVGIPSIGALKMFLDVGGFADVNVEIDPTAYSNAVAGGWRSFSAVCITASPRISPIRATYWVEEYEGGLVRTLLPIAVTEALYRIYCQNGRLETGDSLFVQLVVDMISGNNCELDQMQYNMQSEIAKKYALCAI